MERSRGSPQRCLFKKKDRIKKHKDIQKVIKSGVALKRHFNDYFYCENEKNKIGIIFKNKPENSVVRNKNKRRIREIYRQCRKDKKMNIIVKIKKYSLKNKYKDIREEMEGIIDSNKKRIDINSK